MPNDLVKDVEIARVGDPDLIIISPQPNTEDQRDQWKKWQQMSQSKKAESDKISKQFYGMTNKEHHTFIMREYWNQPLLESKFQLIFESILTDTIQTVDELKDFYQTISYETTKRDHDFQNSWRLLTPAEIIENRVGICYDTAAMSHYYLTKWGIPHKNIFASTQRNLETDPTHTFTIYFDGTNWNWLEGSWEPFKNNTFKSKDPTELINWILTALTNNSKLTYKAIEFKNFPNYGTTLNDFYNYFQKLTDSLT